MYMSTWASQKASNGSGLNLFRQSLGYKGVGPLRDIHPFKRVRRVSRGLMHTYLCPLIFCLQELSLWKTVKGLLGSQDLKHTRI